MKILLAGDFCPTESSYPFFENQDIDTLFGDAISLFDGNDVNFVNLECALTNHDKGITKYGPCLKGTPIAAEVMKKVGINLAGLSNNHIFDYGIQGYNDTVAALNKVGIRYTGFGDNYDDARKNCIVEKNGEKVCFICVCEHEYSYALSDRMGSRVYDCYDTIADIRTARQECDSVIVIYHGGKENCQYPSPRMRKLAHAVIDAGADLFLAQHCHCIACSETYCGKPIFYGQGNFHFTNKQGPNYPHWPYAFALRFDTKTGDFERIFINTNSESSGIELTKGDTLKAQIELSQRLDQSMLDGSYIDGYHNYCESVRAEYEEFLTNAFAQNASDWSRGVFGHYLDCEAHHDMLVEYNKTANHTNEK